MNPDEPFAEAVREALAGRIATALATEAEDMTGILGGPVVSTAGAWATSSSSLTTADLLAALDEAKLEMPPAPAEPVMCWRGTTAELFRQLERAGAQPLPGEPGPFPCWIPWVVPPLYGLAVEQHGDHVLIGTPAQLAEVNEKGEAWIQAQVRRAERLWGNAEGRPGRAGDFSRLLGT